MVFLTFRKFFPEGISDKKFKDKFPLFLDELVSASNHLSPHEMETTFKNFILLEYNRYVIEQKIACNIENLEEIIQDQEKYRKFMNENNFNFDFNVLKDLLQCTQSCISSADKDSIKEFHREYKTKINLT